MSDPFYKIYNIILDELHKKIKINGWAFPTLGDSDLNNLCNLEPKKNNYPNIIFHDQEQLNYENWKDRIRQDQRFIKPHILSNSEINSVDKDELLKNDYIDFYWFSNALLALEWYRFDQYDRSQRSLSRKFSCFNNLIDNKVHRLVIANKMLSYPRDQLTLTIPSKDEHTGRNVSEIDLSILDPDLRNLSNLGTDIIINNNHDKTGNYSFISDSAVIQRSFCHVVTETLFFTRKIHLTEKIFRPIVARRPFMIAGPPMSLEYLRSYGFKTFGKWIDESYDNETNHNDRLRSLLAELDRLQKIPLEEMASMLVDMSGVIDHNRKHFFGDFRQIVIDEMFSNLDQAVDQMVQRLTKTKRLEWFEKINRDYVGDRSDLYSQAELNEFLSTIENGWDERFYEIDPNTSDPAEQKIVRMYVSRFNDGNFDLE